LLLSGFLPTGDVATDSPGVIPTLSGGGNPLIQLRLSLDHLHCIPTFSVLSMPCDMVRYRNIKARLVNAN